jgi:hypothetical protein
MSNHLEHLIDADSQVRNTDPDVFTSLTLAERQVLERAVAKFVLLGEHAGVSVDQMILLLGSGLTVAELVEYVVDRCGQVS